VSGRRAIGQQVRDQRAVLCEQLVYRGCDMFWSDLREARQTGKIQ